MSPPTRPNPTTTTPPRPYVVEAFRLDRDDVEVEIQQPLAAQSEAQPHADDGDVEIGLAAVLVLDGARERLDVCADGKLAVLVVVAGFL